MCFERCPSRPTRIAKIYLYFFVKFSMLFHFLCHNDNIFFYQLQFKFINFLILIYEDEIICNVLFDFRLVGYPGKGVHNSLAQTLIYLSIYLSKPLSIYHSIRLSIYLYCYLSIPLCYLSISPLSLPNPFIIPEWLDVE